MGLFNFKKNNSKNNEPSCACNTPSEKTNEKNLCNEYGNTIVSIKVLGSGCKTCHKLYENTKQAVKNVGLDIEVEYITDLEKIMEYGIMSMPGLVINEKVASTGRLLQSADIESLLNK